MQVAATGHQDAISSAMIHLVMQDFGAYYVGLQAIYNHVVDPTRQVWIRSLITPAASYTLP